MMKLWLPSVVFFHYYVVWSIAALFNFISAIFTFYLFVVYFLQFPVRVKMALTIVHACAWRLVMPPTGVPVQHTETWCCRRTTKHAQVSFLYYYYWGNLMFYICLSFCSQWSVACDKNPFLQNLCHLTSVEFHSMRFILPKKKLLSNNECWNIKYQRERRASLIP